MSRPFTLNDSDHSEKAEMMRKAFHEAYNEDAICFYCEENESSMIRLGQFACEECGTKDIRTSAPTHTMNEKAKAQMVKMTIKIFKSFNKEEEMLEESTDPNKLMKWLEKKAKYINIQSHFKIEYEKFLEAWTRVYGNTDNIPPSFKNDINNKFKQMRKGF